MPVMAQPLSDLYLRPWLSRRRICAFGHGAAAAGSVPSVMVRPPSDLYRSPAGFMLETEAGFMLEPREDSSYNMI